jgi:hypothetical protein
MRDKKGTRRSWRDGLLVRGLVAVDRRATGSLAIAHL